MLQRIPRDGSLYHRRSVRRSLSMLVALLGTILLGAPLAAGDKRGRPSPTFEEVVEAVEVRVPVTVVGKDGQPVRFLDVEDFQILDDGRRQEIVDFQMIDLDALEPGWSRSRIERAVPAAARRYFLLLFDLSFSRPGAIVKAREAAREFVVDALHPTDLAAVAVLTAETGPRLVVTFSPDRAQLARAIDAVGAPELLHLVGGRDPLRFVIEKSASAGGVVAQSRTPVSSENFRSVNPEVQGYLDVIGQRMSSVERSFERGRIDGWSNSMARLARALNSLRGRKYLVYFSEGFDSQLLHGRPIDEMGTVGGRQLSPLERNQQGVLDTDQVYGSGQLQNAVDKMLQEFRRGDCVIEAIDISGLADTSEDQGDSLASKGSLFYLANETGGEVFDDGNRFDQQLELMLRRTAVTYLLTFQPSRLKQDGRYHRLKVKAAMPAGARLTHRAGYYAPRPFDELHPFEKDLLIADAIAAAEPVSHVAMDVLAAPFPSGEAGAYVPVVVEVAGESLIIGHEEDHLPIEIYAYVTNEGGEMVDFFTHVLTFDLAGRREVFQQTGLKYYGHLDLSSGDDYLLRVVVRNGRTGRTGVETIALGVPEYTGHRPIVLPPFFVEPARRWFMVREQPPQEVDEKWFVYPFTIDGEPFVPAVRPVLRQEEAIDLCLIAYNLGVERAGLQGRVVTAEGDPVTGGHVDLQEHIVATRDGVDKFVIRFSPEGLEPGDYRLQLELMDPAWGQAALQQVPFAITD